MEQRKNPEVSPLAQRPLLVGTGMLIALSLVLMAFEWRSFSTRITELFMPEPLETVKEEIINYIPPPPMATPPPPPPSVVEQIEIVEDDVEIEVDIVIDVESDIITEVDETGFGEVREAVTDEVFTIVEDMPRFRGCEKEKTAQAADECFQRELYKFLSANLRYPAQAKAANLQGKVFVSFVVDKDGSVTDVKVLRGIGGGCDEEAVRVIKMLPKFTPGKQRGRPAKVMYQLPINFKLN
jgi:periplasmic protein TonB